MFVQGQGNPMFGQGVQGNPGQGVPAQVNPGQGKPTNPQGMPMNAQVQGMPMNAQVQGMPMNAQVQGLPMNAQVQGMPINAQVQGMPMNAQVQGLPMNAQVQGMPMNAQVQGMPINAQVQGMPMNAQVIPGQGIPVQGNPGQGKPTNPQGMPMNAQVQGMANNPQPNQMNQGNPQFFNQTNQGNVRFQPNNSIYQGNPQFQANNSMNQGNAQYQHQMMMHRINQFPSLSYLCSGNYDENYTISSWKYIDAVYSLIPDDFLFSLFMNCHYLFIPTMMYLKTFLTLMPEDQIPKMYRFRRGKYSHEGQCLNTTRFCSLQPIENMNRFFMDELMNIHNKPVVEQYMNCYESVMPMISDLFFQKYPSQWVKEAVTKIPANLLVSAVEISNDKPVNKPVNVQPSGQQNPNGAGQVEEEEPLIPPMNIKGKKK